MLTNFAKIAYITFPDMKSLVLGKTRRKEETGNKQKIPETINSF